MLAVVLVVLFVLSPIVLPLAFAAPRPVLSVALMFALGIAALVALTLETIQ